MFLHGQLANAERRLAKRDMGGRFGVARAFYAASVDALEREAAFPAVSPDLARPPPSASIRIPGAAGAAQGAAQPEGGALRRQADAARRRAAEEEQHVRVSESEKLDGDPARDLVRALRSWARTEGWLG